MSHNLKQGNETSHAFYECSTTIVLIFRLCKNSILGHMDSTRRSQPSHSVLSFAILEDKGFLEFALLLSLLSLFKMPQRIGKHLHGSIEINRLYIAETTGEDSN